MKDYEIQIRVKNAPFLNLLRLHGMTSADLYRATGVSENTISRMLNLKDPLYTKTFKVCASAQKIADFFNVTPENLYPETHHYDALLNNKGSVQVNADEIHTLTHQVEVEPDKILEKLDLHNTLMNHIKTLPSLTDAEKQVISLRYNDDLTCEEAGKVLDLTKSRIQQLEQRALRKLRHPKRAEVVGREFSKYYDEVMDRHAVIQEQLDREESQRFAEIARANELKRKLAEARVVREPTESERMAKALADKIREADSAFKATRERRERLYEEIEQRNKG